ncbi:MAG: glucuronate isomerase [Lachnospiraceae bacterium]|nr:glucuronate isomerase [Lachnospiraceae bacterium]
MKKFLDDDFLLNSDVAKKLYNEYAKPLPIIDYHCHIDVKDIANDKRFNNITELWLGGDHYKWRYMRACGIEEKYITGDASDKEKFIKWIEALSLAIGNPLYHWSHLELKNYFGFSDHVKKENAEEIWDLCNEIIQSADFSARKIIEGSNVSALCTTDDPIDSLEYHKAISNDPDFKCRVLPAFRPDNALALNKSDYTDYLQKLSDVCGFPIRSFEDLKKALSERIHFFRKNGCVLADHGLVYIPFDPVSDEEADRIFKNRLNGISLTSGEHERFLTAILLFLHKEYKEAGFVSQLHFGCKRDNNSEMFKKIGPNTGFDCIASETSGDKLADLLDFLDQNNALGKMIVYSLNPNDNEIIDTVIACFQNDEAIGKIQHGSAWWFNDNKTGMENHLISLANNSSLSSFIGMLTDSRSFISYTRHEYFRRILCNFLGETVEKGEYPEDYELLGTIVKNISFQNAARYFNLE